MRILIVHNRYQDLGGEDVVFEQECKLLSGQPNVSIFTLTFQNQKGFRGLGQFLLLPWNLLAGRRLHRKIRETNPDIIHIHNTQYACGPLLIRTAKKLGVPVVMTLHNFRLLCPSATLFYNGKIFTDSLHQNFPWTAVKKKVLDGSLLKTFWTAFSYWLHRRIGTWNMVDRYFVLTDFAKKLFLDSSLHIPPHKLVVKPNCATKLDGSNDIEEREPYFLYVGRLSPEKGVLEFLRRVAPFSFEIVVAGDGPDRQAVENISKKSKHIRYLGFQNKEQVTRLMAKSSALVVPSVCYEGMPLSVLEAYSMGTPVLANNLGALPELIKQNETGFLINANDPESIRQALSAVANLDPAQKEKISLNCKHFYQEHFHTTVVINKLLEVYGELTDPSRNP